MNQVEIWQRNYIANGKQEVLEAGKEKKWK